MRWALRCALLALTVAAACRSRAAHPDLRERLSGRRVDAHRGGFRYADSNTIPRFEAALRAGADIVETDLRLSRDGVVFLFHDGDLAPRTSCSGELATKTAAEIERCTLQGLERGPERFEDLLRWDAGRIVIDADLKAAEVTLPALELVRRYDAHEWVYFEAGENTALYRAIRAHDARAAVLLSPPRGMGDGALRELLALDDPRFLIVGLRPDALTEANLAAIRASGKRSSINAWTLVDEQVEPEAGPRTASCDEAFGRGVDIAVTNDPQDCVRQREALPR